MQCNGCYVIDAMFLFDTNVYHNVTESTKTVSCYSVMHYMQISKAMLKATHIATV